MLLSSHLRLIPFLLGRTKFLFRQKPLGGGGAVPSCSAPRQWGGDRLRHREVAAAAARPERTNAAFQVHGRNPILLSALSVGRNRVEKRGGDRGSGDLFGGEQGSFPTWEIEVHFCCSPCLSLSITPGGATRSGTDLRPGGGDVGSGGQILLPGNGTRLRALWPHPAEPRVGTSKSQNVGSQRGPWRAGSWPSVLVRGRDPERFPVQHFICIKEKTSQHLRAGEDSGVCMCVYTAGPGVTAHGPGVTAHGPVVTAHGSADAGGTVAPRLLHGGHFPSGPCVCLAKPRIGKTKGFPASFH